MPAVSVLKACPLFKGFTDTGLQIIAAACNERTFDKGDPLFVENGLAESMLVIGQGRVSLRSKGSGEEEIALGELGSGDYLGELCLVQTGKRLCTATASENVLAAELRHADFQKLLAQRPQACTKLLIAIFEQLAKKLTENRELFRAALQKK